METPEMLYKKVFTFFLCLVFLGQSLAQSKPADETKPAAQIAPALQEKSVALLNALAREADQFYLPENRVSARVLVANLLWEHDEKQSRVIFQNAVSELSTLLGQVSLETSEEDLEEGNLTIEAIKELRSKLLLALAAHDPNFALEALQKLSRRKDDGESVFADDNTLELNLAEQIAEKDPKQAYGIAVKNLQKGLGTNLFSALESIYEKDAELGARLAREVLGKIKSKDTKIISSGDYAANSMAMGSAMSNGSMTNSRSAVVQETIFSANVWEIQQFLQTIKKLNRQAVKDKKTPLLTDAEIKDLVEVLAQKYVKQQYLSPYEVAQVMDDIGKYFPASAQLIRQKMAKGSTELDNQIRNQEVQSEIEDKTAEEIFQIAEKKPVGERDGFYRQAAEKAFGEGDLLKAKDYYARVKKREEYEYLGTKIEEGLPLALARKGDMREVRQMLAKVKTPEKRIEILSALAASVMQNGDKKTATALIDEARSLYSGKMKQRRNLTSVMQLAQGYAVVEPDQSFALLEGNVSYFNDIIAAGILLDDFNEYGSVKSDEVTLDVVRAESYRSTPGGVALIKKLATVDFDRSAALAEKFARNETRFFARFRIVEALLDPDAEDTEKEMQQSEERGEY